MMILKIGDKVEKIQAFSGPDEAVVTAQNIDEIQGYVRGGLMKIVGSFPAPENKPESTNENPGVLSGDTKTGKRGRRSSPKSEGS